MDSSVLVANGVHTNGFPNMHSDPAERFKAFAAVPAMMLGYAQSLNMRALVDLSIPDMLAKAEGGKLSVKQIAEQLPSKTVQLDYLYRILRFARLNGILAGIPTSSPKGGSDELMDIGDIEFGCTPLTMTLVRENNPLSMAHLLLFQSGREAVQPWFHLAEAVLTGTTPFELEHGKSLWDMIRGDTVFASTFNMGMASTSMETMSLLKIYKGFEGLKRVVDVGGGVGATLSMIREAHPEVEGINFDLPHVVATAPQIPGVKHVGGDMFASVPQGDAIVMKWILHDWDDENSIKILKNCYTAIPENGKVVLLETVLADPDVATGNRELILGYSSDMVMMGLTTSGRERTAAEWRALLRKAGFQRMEITESPVMCAIEAFKF